MVTTIKDKCRTCYTCVRECPAKAIRISVGQAEVIPERCIGCGKCVLVCSQKAKKVMDSKVPVLELLQSNQKVAAVIAPSFPADFAEFTHQELVGMIRAIGFTYVTEVGFGADLVAREMKRLYTETNRRYITTACPALFGYVKRYKPELVQYLAPVVSPMIAIARALKVLHGDDLKVVFIGPCIAKKGEAQRDSVAYEVEEALTFVELRKLFDQLEITKDKIKPSDFDPPFASRGNLFPIRRGLLEAAEINEDLIAGEIVSANGRDKFIEALDEFSSGDMNARLLDVLVCDGCIMGAGNYIKGSLYRKRNLVSRYVRQTINQRDYDEWQKYMDQLANIDLSRQFDIMDQRLPNPEVDEIRRIMSLMGKIKPEDELNCGACGYSTCIEHAIAIHQGLAENEMCLPFTIEKLHRAIEDLNLSHEKLNTARQALIQAEKMASMGQMAAGIAHEVNNPLGVVLMYAHLLSEDVPEDSEMHDDLQMIVKEADRCKNIVSGLLNFARKNKVKHQLIDINDMLVNFAKSINLPSKISVDVVNNLEDPFIELDHDQMIQVITNLVNNSVAAMPDGGQITLTLSSGKGGVNLAISDTGSGIPEEHLSKIFEPFFTTKKAGQGTGLGLSIIYGIIKMHNGNINVASNNNPAKGPTGTTFTITIPRKKKQS